MPSDIIALTDDAGEWTAILIPLSMAEDTAQAVAAYRAHLESAYGVRGVTNAGAHGPHLYALLDGEWRRVLHAPATAQSGYYWRVESGYVG